MATTEPVKSTKITWSYVCAVIGIFVLPIILGPVAWFLARSAGREGDARAETAKTFAIVATVLGIALGIIFFIST